MTEQEYRQHSGVNKSTLWEIMRSPAHYKYILENERADTEAFRIGRAIHSAILTPNVFRKEFVTLPVCDRRTKEGREIWDTFQTQNAGKDFLSADERQTVAEIARKVRSNPDIMGLLKGTKREQPMFYADPDTGIDCKCRCDAIRKGLVIDLKTATDAGTESFSKDAIRYGYDVQCAHYSLAHKIAYGELPEWYFIVVEKKPPYAVNILKADGSFIDHGFLRRQTLMEKLKHCIDTDIWQDYGTNDLILPEWMVMDA